MQRIAGLRYVEHRGAKDHDDYFDGSSFMALDLLEATGRAVHVRLNFVFQVSNDDRSEQDEAKAPGTSALTRRLRPFTNTKFCPKTACMVINNDICCGFSANGPPVPNFVKVRWKPDPNKEVTIVKIDVQAGFDGDSTSETSRPTCSGIFEWPGTSEGKALLLHFTEKFELAYADNTIIQQHFSTEENSCPYQRGLQPTTNPYHKPKSPKQVDDSNKQSNAGAEDSFNQATGYFPWIGIIGSPGSVANAIEDSYNNANVNPSNVADTKPADLINPSNSRPAKLSSSPDFAPLWPGEISSTIGVNLNTVGSDEDDCTEYGCGGTSFMQWNPNTSKRGMPVEFRA
ncbi:hypothetical protein MMC07_004024 [Pseudocyphellaria aurata]|nr:hypothetical protein [Pseudocyphellaria aurata]